MYIAICDADNAAADEIKHLIYEYANLRGLEPVVSVYNSGRRLLADALKYPLVMLGSSSIDLDGLETAGLLRKKNGFCAIIFLSACTGFILDAFKVRPYRFLLKPVNKKAFFAALDDFFGDCSRIKPLWIKDGAETFCVNAGEIFYLEADNKNCLIALRENKIHCRKTMARVCDALPESCFCKINRAYIVNLNHIAAYNSESVRLLNGERLHVSRGYFKSFKSKYRNFLSPEEL